MYRLLRLIGFRHLVERPVRTAVTVLGIALGVAVSVAIRTANVDVLKSFQDAVLQVAGRATLQVSGGELGLDERVIVEVRQHPSVVSATPVLHQAARVAAGPHEGQALVVMGLDLLEAATLMEFRLALQAGADVDFEALLAPDAVFVGTRLATEWDLAVGKPVDILVGTKVHRVVVRGIVESGAGLRSAWEQMVVMDIAAAQALFGVVGRLDRIELVTEPGRPVDGIAAELRALLPPPLAVARPSHRNEQIERMVRAMQVNLATLGGVGLLIGLLLVYNTAAFAVVQRRREIGILRALGMSRGGVSALFLAEAGLMGLTGGVVGTVMGVVLARSLVTLLSRTVSDLYVSLGSLSPGRGLELGVPPEMWGQGCLLGIAVSMLGAAGPSLDASRTAPARALAPGEYEAGQELRAVPLAWLGATGLVVAALLALPGPVQGMPLWGYASAFCLLLSLSCLAPAVVRGGGALTRMGRSVTPTSFSSAIGRIAIDQVARAPGRNGVTVSALMVGLAVMIGVGVMIHSFRRTVEHWIHQTVLADLVVAPTTWLQGDDSGMLSKRMPLAWRDTLTAIPGIAAVDPYRELTVELQGRPVSLVSRDLGLHAQRSRYLFLEGDSMLTLRRTVASEGVVVSEVLADALGVRRGDRLRLVTPSGEATFPLVGVFYDYATDGGKLVMDGALYRRLWRDDTTTVLAVYLETDTQAAEVRRRIADTIGREGHVVVIGNSELKTEILAIFDRTFRVTYALEIIAMLIAVLGIVNTLLTSVVERQRELATLRAIGASRRQIARLVLWESCWLGLLGAGLGVPGGVFLSVLLIEVINKQSFGWTIQWSLPIELFLQAIGLALAAAVAAGYFPSRWAAKQSVADGLKYE
jgi:putative ABC transport system permease protein